MLCGHCGEEATRGAFFCGGCGRPLGFKRDAEDAAPEPHGLSDVPAPEKSRDAGPVATTGAKALCSRCMGAYPESELATVDGTRLCGDCNTLTASRSPRFTPLEKEPDFAPRRTVQIPHGASAPSAGGFRRMAVVLGLVVAVAGIFAVIALPGSDRIDRLLSGAKGGPEEVCLGQTYVAGESFEYGMVTRTKITMEADDGVPFGGDISGNMELDLAGLIRIDVLSVDPAGNGRVELTFSGFEAVMRAEMDGQQIERSLDQEFQGICQSTVSMTLDPYGKLIGEAEVDGPGLGKLLDLSQLFGEGLDGAPRSGLRVGDVWRSRTPVAVDADGTQSMDVDAEYEVIGFKHFEGRPCVVLSVRGTLSGKEGHGADVDADLKGAMLINRQSGCLVKSAMDVDVRVSGSTPAGNIDLAMTISVDVDLK